MGGEIVHEHRHRRHQNTRLPLGARPFPSDSRIHGITGSRWEPRVRAQGRKFVAQSAHHVSELPPAEDHKRDKHTAQTPATEPTTPPEIIMGRRPRVLLNTMPLSAPASTLLAASCLPRRLPTRELRQ